MSVLKAKDVEGALCRKGFEKHNRDHLKFWLYVDGRKTYISTMTSHNGQEIGDSLQSCMARQMGLTKSEFLAFVSCTISGEKYVSLLRDRGKL